MSLPTRPDLTRSQYLLGHAEAFLKRLPDKSVDLIYTDPPWGKGYKSNIPGDRRWNKQTDPTNRLKHRFKEILNDKPDDLDWSLIVSEMNRVLKPRRYLVLHADPPFWARLYPLLESSFKLAFQGVWFKHVAFGGNLKSTLIRGWEPIFYHTKGKALRSFAPNTRDKFFDFVLSDKEKIGHPTQKPLELCAAVIRQVTLPGWVVVDPFAGSNSIAVAAQHTGRIGIGVEADKAVWKRFKSRQWNAPPISPPDRP